MALLEVALPNEVFYSFHKDEISAALLLYTCKVTFLCKDIELPPSGVSSFICHRVYDTTSKCLWWIATRSYTDVSFFFSFSQHPLLEPRFVMIKRFSDDLQKKMYLGSSPPPLSFFDSEVLVTLVVGCSVLFTSLIYECCKICVVPFCLAGRCIGRTLFVRKIGSNVVNFPL